MVVGAHHARDKYGNNLDAITAHNAITALAIREESAGKTMVCTYQVILPSSIVAWVLYVLYKASTVHYNCMPVILIHY